MKSGKKGYPLVGWMIISLLSLLPVAVLFFFGPEKDLLDFVDATHALGQITALIGTTLFALSFVLSTRMRLIEAIFGGLDKVYKVHSIIGSISLTLLLAHPVLLVLKYIPKEIYKAAFFLLPSTHWSINYGIIALVGMIFLIYLTIFSKIKYHFWKFTHEFFGLLFIFAILHIFLVRDSVARDSIFTGYYVYVTIVSFIGLLSFAYSLLIRSKASRLMYNVTSVSFPNNDVTDIIMYPIKKGIKYKAGQFVFVSFLNNEVGREPHPFSIASGSNSKDLRIIAKNLGDFTRKLKHVNVGDRVLIEGPYGYFNKQGVNNKQIWLAGGIGITPFIGMAEDIKGVIGKTKADLFYTVRKKNEYVCLKKFRDIENETSSFRMHIKDSDSEGYLTIAEIKEKAEVIKGKDIYICGPGPFKEAMKTGLVDAGVPISKIYWEDFNFR